MENLGLHSTAWVFHPCQTPHLLDPLENSDCQFGPADLTRSPYPSTWGAFAREYLSYYNTFANLLPNGYIENKGSNGWSCLDGACIIVLSKGHLTSLNTNNIKENIENREVSTSPDLSIQAVKQQSWLSLAQTVSTSQLTNGKTYYSEVWVRQDSNTVVNFDIVMKLESSGSSDYRIVGTGTTQIGEWTKISGKQMLSWPGTLTKATWFIKPQLDVGSFIIDNAILSIQ